MSIANWFKSQYELIAEIKRTKIEYDKLKVNYELSQNARLRLCNDIDKLEAKCFRLEQELNDSKKHANELSNEVISFMTKHI